MKAVVYRRYGGPEVLEYTDVPDPKVAQNSVLVRVRAAGLNPADHMLQAGLGESHTDAWFPVIPGWDVAGVVERVGAGVSEFAPGVHRCASGRSWRRACRSRPGIGARRA